MGNLVLHVLLLDFFPSGCSGENNRGSVDTVPSNSEDRQDFRLV